MTKKDGDKVTTYGGSDYHSVDYFTYVKQQVDGTDRYSMIRRDFRTSTAILS